jgi:hypothetical protein
MVFKLLTLNLYISIMPYLQVSNLLTGEGNMRDDYLRLLALRMELSKKEMLESKEKMLRREERYLESSK